VLAALVSAPGWWRCWVCRLKDAIAAFADGAWGSPYALAASINRALVLMLVGLGFVLAERASLTNVGGEGQIAVGGMAATALACGRPSRACRWASPSSFPCWAPAWPARVGRHRRRAEGEGGHQRGDRHAAAVLHRRVDGVRQRAVRKAAAPAHDDLGHAARIAGDPGSRPGCPCSAAILRCRCMRACCSASCWRCWSPSFSGGPCWASSCAPAGLNPRAARRAGMPIDALSIGVLCAAGALGGLAGACMLQGEQYTLKAGFSSGYGFDGLVVGLLARGSVTGVVAGSLLFGFLRSGGINMEMVAQVPTALVVVIQGVIIVTLAGAALAIQRMEKGRAA
jgi:simple sugar transport system permease protein